MTRTRDVDAIVIGAGFAGLYMLYRLRELGLRAQVFEAGDGVGGTWYWNRYPGARCDSESHFYSFSFSDELLQEWDWTERFPSQPEILRYLDHVADRFDLRRDIQLGTRVIAATFDEQAGRWLVDTADGERAGAQFLISAVGCLSATNLPAIPGRSSFAGESYHTGRWPQTEVELRGKRVGVIGTGSTGIQIIPVIAEQAAHLTVFQRTPNFSVPARNAPLDPDFMTQVKAQYPQMWDKARHSPGGLPLDPPTTAIDEVSLEEARRRYEAGWQKGGVYALAPFKDLTVSQQCNDVASDFVRDKIRAIVRDPATTEALLPRDHPIATKRPAMDTNYYETYNRDNVSLVDVRSTPIEEITPTGIRTATAEYDLDVIVFATGYDAMTGPLNAIEIRGRDGHLLRETWADGPVTYLGLAVAGYPNLFLITGPGSPSVMTNMPVSIEQHVEWIGDCVAALRAEAFDLIEATPQAQQDWVGHVLTAAEKTLYPQANSWWLGANIPGKPRVFMPYVGGVGVYREECREVAENGYLGFHRTSR